MSRAERYIIASDLRDAPTANRPRTRGECADGPRPCPFVSCRYHLALDVDPEVGTIRLNWPHLEIDQLAETCALDVADRGGMTLEDVGGILNITRERVRQLEQEALRVMHLLGLE